MSVIMRLDSADVGAHLDVIMAFFLEDIRQLLEDKTMQCPDIDCNDMLEMDVTN